MAIPATNNISASTITQIRSIIWHFRKKYHHFDIDAIAG
jgi:hypothetical protein